MTDQATSEPIEQIAIERVVECDGSSAWLWSVFVADRETAFGTAQTLSQALDTMREYLRDEGIAP